MDKLYSLLKVQLLSCFGINKLAHKKTKRGKAKIAGVGFILLGIGVLIFFMSFIYTAMFADIFYQFDLLTYYIPLVFTLLSFITFIFSIGNVNGVIFGFKDYNMLMSLPIKTDIVIVSKLIYSYLSDLFFTVMIMIPALINYALYTTNTFSFYLFYIIAMFFAPLVPIALAMIISTFFSFITARLKYKNQINTILLAVFFILIFVFSFTMGYMGDEAIAGLANIANIYPLAILFNHALTSFWQLLLFIAVSLFVFAIPSVLIGLFFVKINTLLLSRTTSKKYKFKETKGKSKLGALLSREVKRIFATPVYAINCLLGLVMIIGLTILLGTQVGSLIQIDGVKEIISGVLPCAIGFIVTLSPTTNCSISMEGKTFWIIKASPVPTETVLISKIMLNSVFYVPVTLICSVVLAILLQMNVFLAILFVIINILFVLFGGVVGLLINLRFPMMNWENETAPVKKGVATLFTMLINFGACIVLGVLSFFLIKISLLLALIVVLAILLISTASMFYILLSRGVNLYNNI